MNTDQDKPINTDLLYPNLSYKIRGAIMSVSNKYGKGLKEGIYQKALAEEFDKLGIKYEQQKRITIYSVESGEPLG
jgi:GxxExxY protein